MEDSSEEENRNTVISRQLGYRREFVFPNLLKVHVPTISYETFDQAGHVSPWSLVKLLETGWTEDAWCMEDKHEYMLQQDTIIDASLYNTHSPKFPLDMEYTHTFVNKSSRNAKATLYHQSMPKPYAVQESLLVNIDPVTRRTTPYPSGWREKYKFPTSDVKLKVTELYPPEDGKYITNHRSVHFSDIDLNNHMNNTAYIRLCYESLFENMFADKHCYGTDGVLVGNTREIHVNFKRPCLLGTVLTIKSWKENKSSNTYHFEMWTEKELAANVTLAFFNPGLQYSKNSKL